MKAIRQYEFGDAGVLKCEEVPVPVIAQNEVLIKGAYTSINYADIKSRIGSKAKGAFPFTLGLDIAGFIEDGGNTRFKKGDRVIAFPDKGSYAEYVTAKEDLVFLLPGSISMEQAAAMPTVSILAYMLLHEIAHVVESDVIVIHSAAGGVGTMLTQFAKLFGVRKIIATVGDLKKEEHVRQMGAEVVCHYDVFVETVLEETEGKGATVIFDSVAGDITQKSLACLANYGTLVQFGNSSGLKGEFSTADVHSSCRNIKGFSLGTTRKENPKRLAPAAHKIFDYLLAGKVHIPITEIFELQDVQHAHQLMEGRTHQGKILLKL